MGNREPDFITVPFGQIRPWGKNPRNYTRHELTKLARSLREKGQFKNLVCWQENGNYVIGGGNLRYQAMARILKWPEDKMVQISVNYPGTEQEKLELTLLDNASSGFYEEDKLAALAIEQPELKLDEFNVEIGPEKITLQEVVTKNRPHVETPDKENEVAQGPAREYKKLFKDMKRSTQAFLPLEGPMACAPLPDYLNSHENIIVTFSGGKDSVAAALWTLANIHDREKLTILYCDTGIDFPDMKQYIKYCQIKFKHPITTVGPQNDDLFCQLLAQYGFPGYNNLWCTLKLKTEFLFDYYKKNQLTDNRSVLVMGDRMGESKRRQAHKDRGQFDLRFGYGMLRTNYLCPVLNYTGDDVGTTAQKFGLSLYPGYRYYERNGCFCCTSVPKYKWRILREHYPDLWVKAIRYMGIGTRDPQYRQYFMRDVLKAIGENEPQPPQPWAKYVDVDEIAVTLAAAQKKKKDYLRRINGLTECTNPEMPELGKKSPQH